MKPCLILSLLLAIFLNILGGHTKILREVIISGDDAYRRETFSLKNSDSLTEELVIEGAHSHNIYPKDNTDLVYNIATVYVADKDGYRVKYKLIREPHEEFDVRVQLNSFTLKSLAG